MLHGFFSFSDRTKAMTHGFFSFLDRTKAITHGFFSFLDRTKAIAHGFSSSLDSTKAIVHGFFSFFDRTKAIAHGFCSFVPPAHAKIAQEIGDIQPGRELPDFAGLFPCVKAWDGPLPTDAVGIEFYTDVEPDPWSAPGWPEWSQGRAGVLVLERDELWRYPLLLP
jgi:hypothetical protein